MSTLELITSALRDLPNVVKVEFLQTEHPATLHLKFTVREDTPSVRNTIAKALYDVRPVGVFMLGSEEVAYGVTNSRFDIEVLDYDTWIEGLDEESTCFDSKCSGTMQFDWRECTCGTPSSLGPCSNCEDGLNLVCDACNCNVEELDNTYSSEYSLRGTGRTYNQIKNLKKGSLFVVSHDVTDILVKLKRPDVIMYVVGRRSPNSLCGVSITDIVLDHYLETTGISEELEDRLRDIRRRIRLEENKMEKSFTSSEIKSRLLSDGVGVRIEVPSSPYKPQNHLSGEWIADSSKNDKIKTQKEQQNMTKLNRKQVTVTLIDNDSSLPAASAIVFEKKLISDGSREDIIQEVILQGKVKEALDRHNEIRSSTVNLGILERVGNEVMLRAVELKDLDWNIV